MTPLEAARQMIDRPPFYHDGGGKHCGFCDGCMDVGSPEHDPDCPYLTMPQIVAALEAAQAVVDVQFAAWCAHADTINDLAEAMQGDKG